MTARYVELTVLNAPPVEFEIPEVPEENLRTLPELIRQLKGIPQTKRVRIAEKVGRNVGQLVAALHASHRHYRDLNSNHILIGKGLQPYFRDPERVEPYKPHSEASDLSGLCRGGRYPKDQADLFGSILVSYLSYMREHGDLVAAQNIVRRLTR